ncbi:MAG: EamA family transporter [Patescibacteria group bacterium]
MNWIFFALVNVVAISIASLYQKMAMREEKSDPIVSAIVFQLLTGVCYAVFAWYKGFNLPSVSLVPYFIGTMILYAAGTIFFFRAIKKIEASEMSIIGGVGPINTIIASVLFLRDVFSAQQLLGVLCIISAVVLINFKKGGIVINQGVWLALAGTACYGIAVIFDTIIIRGFEVASFIPIGTAGTSLIMMLTYPRKISHVWKALIYVEKNLLIYSLLYAMAGITFYTAIFTGALVGQVSTVVRSSIILTVILSTVFLGEREGLIKKIIGAILTTVGVILVSQ